MRGKRLAAIAATAAVLLFGLLLFSPFSPVLSAKAAESMYSLSNMLAPVWEGEISYNESVLVVEEADGSVAPIELLYPIEAVREVRNARLDTVYRSGTDFEVVNGKFVVKKGGGIPRLTYGEFHPEEGTQGFESRNGGYVLWKEGSWFHDRQIVITYTHTERYGGYIPEGKGALLSSTLGKLAAGENINMLVYGDSISVGGNSSGHPDIKVPPLMPVYPEMFRAGLEQRFESAGAAVRMINASVGGRDSAAGVGALRSDVLAKYPEEDFDLIVLAYGMNDIKTTVEAYVKNVQKMMRSLRSQYKNAEFLLVAPMLPNYQAEKYWGNQYLFYDALLELEAEGVAAVNVTGMHESLLETKRFADMTGNNVNHANDYMARIYAQTLLRTMEESDYSLPDDPAAPDDPGNQPGDDLGNQPGDEPGNDDTPKDIKGGCSGALSATGAAVATLLFGGALLALQTKRK